jgi:hypothetical protein
MEERAGERRLFISLWFLRSEHKGNPNWPWRCANAKRIANVKL